MMKRTFALTALGALLMLSFSGCALTYSKTRVSGCKEIKECGLLGGLIPLYKSEKPLAPENCASKHGHQMLQFHDFSVKEGQHKENGHSMPEGYSMPEGRPLPKGHSKVEGHFMPADHPKEKEHAK